MLRQALEQLEAERDYGWSLMVRQPDGSEPIPVVPARYLPAVTEFVEAQFEATRRTLAALLTTIEAEDDAADEVLDRPGATPPQQRLARASSHWRPYGRFSGSQQNRPAET
jgi:hypothetical protein